jgi:hypothetical protein
MLAPYVLTVGCILAYCDRGFNPRTVIIIIIIVPLSHDVESAQHVFYLHSLLSVVVSMLTPFIVMSSFTQPIHLYLGRPLLRCSSSFIKFTFFKPHTEQTLNCYIFVSDMFICIQILCAVCSRSGCFINYNKYLYKYIQLTPYPRRGSTDI